MHILATGGAGFIGSHTCVELINAGHSVTIVDDLSNSNEKVVDRIERISGIRPVFYKEDVCDEAAMERIFTENTFDAVIHFAGLKAVGESVRIPLKYYQTNIGAATTLCKVMAAHHCKNIIFSSSATVYGESDVYPLTEDMPKRSCSNPYGWTKWMIEQILIDLHTADPDWNVVLLRYFNPIGAHPSGLIGEDPLGIPNNLLPYIAQVAIGKLERLGVFGDDYDTPDGTGIRDYIHVVDLAEGHVKALKKFESASGVSIYNLGTGTGYSVMDVLHAFERACGHTLPYAVKPRRAGDLAVCYCSPVKAKEELDWEARYNLDEMCAHSWNWQRKNPDGYATVK